MKRVILIFMLLFTLLFAEDNLDTLISQFKSAPKGQKYIYMNQIKMELKKLSATQRANRIKELRAKLSIKKKGANMMGAKMKGIMKSNKHKAGFGKGLGKGMHGGK